MSSNLPRLKPSDILRAVKLGPKALAAVKKVDPKSRYVLLFPHSDAAYVGMGFKLLNTAGEDVYRRAGEIIDRDLFRLCLKGPKEELLQSLENRSIATYVTSQAAIAKLAAENEHIISVSKAAGGIGVGFINCLVFSGALSFEDGLDLVIQTSRAMDKAASIVPSVRALIYLRPATPKRKLCQAAIEHCIKQGIPPEIAVCSVTKQSYPHCIEVGGHIEAINYLENEGTRLFSLKRLVRVKNNPFAFNTELMRPARQYLNVYLDQKLSENSDYLKEPVTCSVYSGTAGCRLRALKNIKRDLLNYPVMPLKVEQLLDCLYTRPRNLAQPNTLVLWDKVLLKTLSLNNRLAFNSAKLLSA